MFGRFFQRRPPPVRSSLPHLPKFSYRDFGKTEALGGERNRSVHYPIRDCAEICVPQIRVSLRRSVCGSIPRTDREHRRSNRPFVSIMVVT